MSKEQTEWHNKFSMLAILSIATFLRYFSPHDILSALYREISLLSLLRMNSEGSSVEL